MSNQPVKGLKVGNYRITPLGLAVLVVLLTLLGSIPAVRTLLRLDPTIVLHGR